ncbi:MAG: DNA polymerase Y family protein [Alphaproteobacteria bacterium]|nr:DNA polymerase Y family protein [Alphaproteobacteria bacterium]
MRRIASIWLPYLASDLARRYRPEWAGKKLALIAERSKRLFVAAPDALAEAGGVVPGQMLADARALAGDLAVTPFDPAATARTLDSITQWCLRYTPAAAPAGEDGVFLDLTGCTPLFGGEPALLADIVARLARQGFEARVAIAGTPGAAWALARFVLDTIAAPGMERATLADLPVEALRLLPETIATLRGLGLGTIGALYDRSRAALARRCGAELCRRLDQALGRVFEPISPVRETPPWRERRDFAEPLLQPQDVAISLRRLIESLCARLAAEGLGARGLECLGFRTDGSTARAGIGTSRPSRDPAHLARLFAEKLSLLDPGDGMDGMVLSPTALDPLAPKQAALVRGGAPAGDIVALLDRLANRLGATNVFALAPVESHRPERAQRRVAPGSAARNLRWPDGTCRPLRLFADPEAIEAMAPAPEDAPLHFTWRRIRRRVRRAEGPERIAAEWWRDAAPVARETRDYYRVEDEDGGRFWLYRQGAGEAARWYLHGLFA